MVCSSAGESGSGFQIGQGHVAGQVQFHSKQGLPVGLALGVVPSTPLASDRVSVWYSMLSLVVSNVPWLPVADLMFFGSYMPMFLMPSSMTQKAS